MRAQCFILPLVSCCVCFLQYLNIVSLSHTPTCKSFILTTTGKFKMEIAVGMYVPFSVHCWYLKYLYPHLLVVNVQLALFFVSFILKTSLFEPVIHYESFK
jgi:hypothetical protein